jgi:hypothetical protein
LERSRCSSGNGGVAYGGGIDVAGGTATLAGSQLLSNQVVGGTGGFDAGYFGGNGGNAFGCGQERECSAAGLAPGVPVRRDASHANHRSPLDAVVSHEYAGQKGG